MWKNDCLQSIDPAVCTNDCGLANTLDIDNYTCLAPAPPTLSLKSSFNNGVDYTYSLSRSLTASDFSIPPYIVDANGDKYSYLTSNVSVIINPGSWGGYISGDALGGVRPVGSSGCDLNMFRDSTGNISNINMKTDTGAGPANSECKQFASELYGVSINEIGIVSVPYSAAAPTTFFDIYVVQ